MSSVHSVCWLSVSKKGVCSCRVCIWTDQQSDNKSIYSEWFKVTRATFLDCRQNGAWHCLCLFLFVSCQSKGGLIPSVWKRFSVWLFVKYKMKRGVGVIVTLISKSLYSISAIIHFCSLVSFIRRWVPSSVPTGLLLSERLPSAALLCCFFDFSYSSSNLYP